MKKEEIECNMKNYVYQLIDNVIPPDGFLNKVENATAKYWVEQNQWRLDEILSAFTDKEGCIDGENLVRQYESVLFENGELRMQISDILPNSLMGIIPDKIVVFRKEDLHKLIGV